MWGCEMFSGTCHDNCDGGGGVDSANFATNDCDDDDDNANDAIW